MIITQVPSPNHEVRRGTSAPDMIVLHYTGMPVAEDALRWLCRPESGVSSHYFVFRDGRVAQLVDERRRAWHAGVSHWAGASDLNSRSIGIEIDNPGHEHGYLDFPDEQIAAVIALLDAIRSRWPIADARILGHSDIAPDRKQDPGERFPWASLAAAGHGLWPSLETPTAEAADEGRGNAAVAALQADLAAVAALQADLAAFGYDCAATGRLDSATATIVCAFQRHFRPRRVDGIADGETRAILSALLRMVDGGPVRGAARTAAGTAG